MNNLTVLAITLISIILSGCQSGNVMEAGGYKMIHFNNPECMGSSASGGLLVREETDEVISAEIGFKTGYCEAVTGQVIAVGGKVGAAVATSKGLEKSGSSVTNSTNTVTNQDAGLDLGLDDEPEEEPLPQ